MCFVTFKLISPHHSAQAAQHILQASDILGWEDGPQHRKFPESNLWVEELGVPSRELTNPYPTCHRKFFLQIIDSLSAVWTGTVGDGGYVIGILGRQIKFMVGQPVDGSEFCRAPPRMLEKKPEKTTNPWRDFLDGFRDKLLNYQLTNDLLAIWKYRIDSKTLMLFYWFLPFWKWQAIYLETSIPVLFHLAKP